MQYWDKRNVISAGALLQKINSAIEAVGKDENGISQAVHP